MPAITHSGDGSETVRATSTIAAAGRTMLFGITPRSRSVTETATRTQQKNAAIAASTVRPKSSTHAATSDAVTSSTIGYLTGIGEPQFRQRPRRTRYETTGMLSYHAIGASHDMQAE